MLYLTLHDGNQAWKTLDLGTMDRLRAQGFIFAPAVRAKSVMFTEDGLTKAREIADKLFVG